MRIFSSSHTPSSRTDRIRAFSLIEMLITAGIITIITAIVLARNDAFDSVVLGKSYAYEIASVVRDAQVRSVSSVRARTGTGTGLDEFRYPGGITFSKTAHAYTLFEFQDTDMTVEVGYGLTDFTAVGSPVAFKPPFIIEELCLTIDEGPGVGNVEHCDLDRLDIAFRRPEFLAIFKGHPESEPPFDNDEARGAAKIKIKSTRGNPFVWIIEVGLLGSISVSLE